MAKKKNQAVEVRIEIDGIDVTAVPNRHSAEFERLLKQRGAESFVFIPLARLGKKGQRLFGNPAATARKKAKLPAIDWYDGELRSLDDGKAVPGVLAFDIRRRAAREIAEAVGVNQFIWGTSGAPVEEINSGFGAHGDNERISEAAFVDLVKYLWNVIVEISATQ